MTNLYLISKSDDLITHAQSHICYLPPNTPKFPPKTQSIAM